MNFSDLSFPPPAGSKGPCVWTGHGFQVGPSIQSVLAYETGESGWTDDLTSFHESAAGENHYIDLASRAHALSQVKQHVKTAHPAIMDIGCSSGFMLKALRTEFPNARVLGADYVRGPLEHLAKTLPGVPLIQFNLVHCPLPDAMLDAAVLLNVFEHIEQDVEAMRQTCRILKPGGIAVIEVPAGPELFDVYDKQLMHFRRYKLAALVNALESAGFEVLTKSHLGFFLYMPFRMTKKRNQRHLNSSDEDQRKIVKSNIQQARSSGVMNLVMKTELAVGKALEYPAGIRCLVTCRRPAVA